MLSETSTSETPDGRRLLQCSTIHPFDRDDIGAITTRGRRAAALGGKREILRHPHRGEQCENDNERDQNPAAHPLSRAARKLANMRIILYHYDML